MAKISDRDPETTFDDADHFVFSDSSAGLDKRISGSDIRKKAAAFAVASVSDLITLDDSDFATGDKVERLGFYAAGDCEKLPFYWDASEDKANHDGWSVVDPSHTATIGADAWYSSENTGSGCWKTPLGDRYTLAQAGGKGNDTNYNATLALNNMKAALSVGDTIIVNNDYYFAPGFTIDKTLNFKGSGSLIVNNSGDYDQAITISADYVYFEVPVDQSSITTHTGRGEAIRVTGAHCRIIVDGDGERTVRGSSGVSTSNYLYISGDDCRVDGEVRQAAYAAIRQQGAERLHIGKFNAINYGNKGFTYNGSSPNTGSLYIDDWYGTTDSTEATVSGFQLDPGSTNIMNRCYINKIHLNDGGGNGGNSIKLDYVTHFYANEITIENSLDALNSALVINVDRFIVNSFIQNSDQKLNITSDCEYADIEKFRCTSQDSTHAIEFDGAYLHIASMYVSSGTRGLRVEDTAGVGEQRVNIDRLVYDGSDGTAIAITLQGTIYPGQVTVLDYDIITGSSLLTGATSTALLIRRNKGPYREFTDDTDPQSDSSAFTWQRGDVMINKDPSAGGSFGWICVAGGTPGTWKSYGGISS